MRISGGTAKGRRIGFRKAFSKEKDGDELRPTSAKVREALFDIIRNELPDALFLDLYAGAGGIGIEALSRGAGRVVFVESSKPRVAMINDLLFEFHLGDRAKAVNMKARDFVNKEAEKGQKYDIIFLDPPYGSDEMPDILLLVARGKILKTDGLVIAEHFFKKRLPDNADGLAIIKSYRYGDTMLSLYKWKGDREDKE